MSFQSRHARIADRSPALRYGLAIAAVLVALAGRLALNPVLGMNAPYLPFALAVLVAGRVGGRGPALVATGLSGLGVWYFFLEPRNSLALASLHGFAGLALYVVVGVLISLLIGQLSEAHEASIRAEEALRLEAEMVDLSHDAIISSDPKRIIKVWNAGATEMYGWKASEAIGKPIHELLQTTGAVPVSEIDRILYSEGRWDGELLHIAKDGRRLVSESRHILVHGRRGEPAGILEINRDITESKRAQEAVAEGFEQRKLAMDASGLGAWDYRLDTSAMFWDQRCGEIFGLEARGPIDFHDSLANVHPDDRLAVEEAINQAICGANGGAYHREFRVVSPDDSIRWVASHGQVIFDESNGTRRATRFVGVSMDITERRLTEDRLRHTQKLETVGLLAGGIAHDFNNILTVIMGSASVALAACPTCEHSQSIISAAERAAYLTKQLLAYAGKGHMAIKLLDISESVHNSAELLATSVPKKVSLTFDLAKDLPYVETDPSLIEQILMNLVINAGEAISPQEEGKIEITTRSCEVTPEMARRHSQGYDVPAGSYVCLSVRDNGLGMNEATLVRIFDPFFTTKFTGRGLGLAAVHGIVRTSKGFIEATSTPGQGALLQVFLPASAKKREKPVAVSHLSGQGGSATILVVDDEPMVRKLAMLALTRYGYQVLEARHGRDALRLLAEESTVPALALVDLAMPVMGGDELAPILKTQYPSMKILVSSGYPEEDAPKIFGAIRVEGFLQKPYTSTALADKVARTLQSERP